MRLRKSRSIITYEDVSIVFNDACVAKLAETAKLPPGANMDAFAKGIREAARIFVRDARGPNANALHDEIAELQCAADRRLYDQTAALMERLSPRARAMLAERGARPNLGIRLPSPNAIRDPERSEDACATIARLCGIGGKWVEGRRRPGGQRSRPTWRPLLHAPDKQRRFAKREAERDFVMWLSIAWLDATGAQPSRTARHPDASRDVGPFARFVRKCLRLVGAGDANVVELLNELQRRRGEMEAAHD
jgi:hypothetical protein